MSNDLISRREVIDYLRKQKADVIAGREKGGFVSADVCDGMLAAGDAFMNFITEIPAVYDADNVVNRLENCADSITFRYDKELGILYEVEANVWARIKDGIEVEIPIKSGGIE